MTSSHTSGLLTREIVSLGSLLLLLRPGSLLWQAVAVRRGELLCEQIAPDLRFVLLSEPTSVIDL